MKILLVLFIICVGIFELGKISVNATTGTSNVLDEPIDLIEPNVTNVFIIRDDDNDEGVLICTIGYLLETYGTNSLIIIRNDDNDEGVLICSIGDYVETYGTTESLIIRDDDNDEGTLICSIGEINHTI